MCINLYLVNMKQTIPFELGPSNMVHTLLITNGQCQVRGQGHTLKKLNLVNMIKVKIFVLVLSNFVHILIKGAMYKD